MHKLSIGLISCLAILIPASLATATTAKCFSTCDDYSYPPGTTIGNCGTYPSCGGSCNLTRNTYYYHQCRGSANPLACCTTDASTTVTITQENGYCYGTGMGCACGDNGGTSTGILEVSGVKGIRRLCLGLAATGLTSFAVGQSVTQSAYWAARDKALGSYTFVYDLETHERYVAAKPMADQQVDVGGTKMVMPGLNSNFEYDVHSAVTFERKEGQCAISGRIAGFNRMTKRAGYIPVRCFSGDGWVGGITQVPTNGDIKKSMFEVYAQRGSTIAGRVPNSAHEFDGEYAPFLFGGNPFDVYQLDWKQGPSSRDRFQLIASNYVGREAMTNHMASNAPVDLDLEIAPDGRLLGGNVRADVQTNPKALPIHTASVLKWTNVGGYSVPADLLIHLNKDISGKLYSGFLDLHWRLKKAFKTPKTVAPPIPMGTHVADWRLQQSEFDPLNGPNGSVLPGFYQWNGHLPTLDELRGVVAKRLSDEPPTNSFWPTAIAYGVPLCVIAIGLALIISGKRRPKAKGVRA